MQYFSDKEKGTVARNIEVLDPSSWSGIAAQVQALVSTGAFAERFPEMCPDGKGPIETNESAFSASMLAEIPGLIWPLQKMELSPDGFTYKPHAPDTLVILDLIQFCHRNVAKPLRGL